MSSRSGSYHPAHPTQCGSCDFGRVKSGRTKDGEGNDREGVSQSSVPPGPFSWSPDVGTSTPIRRQTLIVRNSRLSERGRRSSSASVSGSRSVGRRREMFVVPSSCCHQRSNEASDSVISTTNRRGDLANQLPSEADSADMVTKLRPPIELYKPPSLRTDGDGNDEGDSFREQLANMQQHVQQSVPDGYQEANSQHVVQNVYQCSPNGQAISPQQTRGPPMSIAMSMSGAIQGAQTTGIFQTAPMPAPLLPTPARFAFQPRPTPQEVYFNNMALYGAAMQWAPAPLGPAALQYSKSTTNLAALYASAAAGFHQPQQQFAAAAGNLYQGNPFAMAGATKQPATVPPRFQQQAAAGHQHHQHSFHQTINHQHQQQVQQPITRPHNATHHHYRVVTGKLNDTSGTSSNHHHQSHHHSGSSIKRSKSLGAADFHRRQAEGATAGRATRSTGFLLHQLPLESREDYAEALSNPRELPAKRLMDLAEKTLANAVADRKLARPCAEVCTAIAMREPGVTFLESLLNSCREWFMRRNEKLFEPSSTPSQFSVIEEKPGAADSSSSSSDSSCTSNASNLPRIATRWLAFVTFVAELYFQMKATWSKQHCDLEPVGILLQILYECVFVSLKSGDLNNATELEALVFLLSSAGKDLDEEKRKKMDNVFSTIRENFLLSSNNLSSDAKKAILQLVEMRASGWQLSKSATVYYYVPSGHHHHHGGAEDGRGRDGRRH